MLRTNTTNKRRLHIEPGADLYNRVRAGFIACGTSFNKWCQEHGVHRQNARLCLLGAWNGPKAQVLRRMLVTDAGVSE